MKHLRETFIDEEWQTLIKAKRRSGKSWHDFILSLAQTFLDSEF